MRIAALDLGSNSFHLLVVEASPDGRFEPLLREKVMLRLGDDVGRLGRISEQRSAAAVDAVVRLVALARSAGAVEVVAKGTAALREAENGTELVDRIESESGVEVEVISGSEEARLVFLAVRASVVLEPSPALVADLGGGSLELVVGDQAGSRWSASARLGVGRLTTELVRDDPPSADDRSRLAGRVEAALAPLMPEVRRHGPRLLVGTSGTLVTLARMAAIRRGGPRPPSLNQLTVARAELEAVHDDLLRLPAAARSRLAGLDSRRAEIIPAGAVVLSELMSLFGFDELTVSDWALREGIVLDVLGTHDPAEWGGDPSALRMSSVMDLGRRCRFQEKHARRVTAMAETLFDACASLHRLDGSDRELLGAACLLHDIGEHVAADSHERHSAYLVMNGRLRGFSPEEVAALASIVRFHRRGAPHKAGFEPFEGLPPEWRERVVRMTALLRVADSLDRAHCGAVAALEVEVLADRVRLLLDAPGGAELETWGLRRKRELFEEVFGVALEALERPA
ncbi:MAG: HD domain-containing protein [Acidimicrobiales bacterium]